MLLLVFAILTLVACDRTPYVEHKVDLNAKEGGCSSKIDAFRLTSNIGGERYEFEKCLPASYDPKSVSAERKGDTVVVKFNTSGPAGSLYQVTLDIDSYPSYHIISIDGETYAVSSTRE